MHRPSSVRKKSRKHTQEILKTFSETDGDECKKFPLLLQKYCEERLYFKNPLIFNCLVREDKKTVLVEHPLTAKSFNEDEDCSSVVRIYTYSNMNMKLKLIFCKSPHGEPIDTRLFYALSETLTHFTHLTILNLDYCNLTAEHIRVLEDQIKSKKTIVQLSVSGNPNERENFYHLFRIGLKILILKFCDIRDRGIDKISMEYLNNPLDPPTINHLDFSHNPLFNVSCKFIARILKCDKNLQSLNLTDCKISDDGFTEILKCFIKFPLESIEIQIRRKLRFDFYKLLLNNKPAQQEETATIIKSVGSTITGSSNSSEINARLLIEQVIKNHPFTNDQTAIPIDGEIYCTTGNNSLNILNFSYNQLMKPSLQFLLKILMEQNQKNGSVDDGLKSINLEGVSKLPECLDLIETIQEFLKNKNLPSKSSESLKRSSNSSSIKHHHNNKSSTNSSSSKSFA